MSSSANKKPSNAAGGPKKSREPSPYGRGYDRQGNLVGAAKVAHAWKEARELGKMVRIQPEHQQDKEHHGSAAAEESNANRGRESSSAHDDHGQGKLPVGPKKKVTREWKESREGYEKAEYSNIE